MSTKGASAGSEKLRLPHQEIARFLYSVDGLLVTILRGGKKPAWIDLSPQQRALEIESKGCPPGVCHPLRARIWLELGKALDRCVEAV